MSTKKYGYVIDSVSGEIQTPDIFSCKYGSLSTLYKIGNISDLRIKVNLGNAFECSFSVYKDTDKESDDNFDNFSDMNAVYIDGFDYFDIKIDLEESSDTVKKVTGKSLSYSELSNGTKVSMEVNTEDDITRKNYDSDFPTLFYRNIDDYSAEEKEAAEKSSFLHRLLTFAPHYKIGHVDETLWGQYRTFSWNNQDFISVLSDVEQEIKCVFHLEIKKDKNGVVNRYIHAYDLEYCEDCYEQFLNDGKTDYRNVSNGKCNNNHSHKILTYGENTDIFISTENLTDSITLSSNKDSIKNMFKVRGGDDIINDALKNINLSGDRIICFSNRMLDSMEDDLKEKFILYQNTVKSYEEESKELMNYIYNSYDVILYLESGKVPYHEKENKRLLEEECNFIAQEMLEENAVSSQDPSKLTVVSSKNIVKSVSGFYTGIGYTTKTSCVTYNKENFKWIGTITVTDSEDPNQYGIIHFNENDTSVELYGYDSLGNPSTSPIKTLNFSSTLSFSGDFEAYVKYKMKLASERYNVDTDDILLSEDALDIKLNQSGLSKLNAYYGAFNAVLEVLKGIGCISNPKLPIDEYCKEKYDICYNRCVTIQEKIDILTEQIYVLNKILNGNEVLNGNKVQDFVYYKDKSILDILQDVKDTIDVKNENGDVSVYYDKTQEITYSSLIDIIIEGYSIYGDTCFLKRKSEIADATNIEHILGNLYPLFCSYIKEDVYENQNYVSDGLNNAEILENARSLLEAANREIKSACELQYTISAPLSCIISYISQNQNGITIEDIYDKFLLGNFVHFKIDDNIFKLRVSSIDFDYNSIDKITVEFTDVNMESNHTTDSINSLLTTMSSIASSYNYTANQAEKSYNTNKEINAIKKEGLDASLININSGINQSVVHDDKGILIRQYDEENELYLPQQMRLNNGNIVLTDNNWESESLRMAIGKGFYNENPVYGVWADVLVGDLIAGNELKISNTNGTVNITGDGIDINSGHIHLKNNEYIIEIDPSHPSKNNLFSIKKIETNEVVMGIDTDGINRFKGHVYADEGTIGIFTIDDTGIYYRPQNQTYDSMHISPDNLCCMGKTNIPIYKENALFKTYSGLGEITISNGEITSLITLDDSNNDMGIAFLKNTLNAMGTKFIKHKADGNDKTLYGLDCVSEKLEVNVPIYSNKSLSLRGNLNFDGSTTENSSGYTGALGISYCGYNMIQFTPRRGLTPVTQVGDETSILNFSSSDDILLDMPSGKMFAPSANDYVNLGGSAYKWKTVYAVTGTIQTSDRNAKNSIENLDNDLVSQFILDLKPVRFKYNDNDSDRYHWGLISQDIEETMENLGMDSKDFAGFIKSPKTIINKDDEEEIVEGKYNYSLRYDEFIAPMIKMIQSQQNRIDELEKTVQKLIDNHL